jgi:hypothetical protein
MAERRRPDEKITMTPRGEPIDAYQQRFAEWVSKIKTPGDVDDLIAKAAEENNWFLETRQTNEISPAHIEKLAKASGWDPARFDPVHLRTRFRSADEMRAVEQVLLQTRDDRRAAVKKVRQDPSAENLAALEEAKARHEVALEYVAAFRDDWGEAGLAQQEFLRREKRREQSTERAKKGMPKEGNSLIEAIQEFGDGASPTALEKLVMEAQKAVEAAKVKEVKEVGAPEEPEPPPEWKELAKTAEAVVKLMDIREPAGPIEVPTVRPLRQLIKEQRSVARSPLAKFNAVISQAERLAGPQKRQAQRALAQQMPPELQALVDKTERIVKRMEDMSDRRRAELQAEAEATAGLDAEGTAYVLGRAWQWTVRHGGPVIDQLFWLRNNWLLSGPITHIFYGLVNITTGLIEHVVLPLFAAAIDKVLPGGNKTFFGEPFAALLGFGHAVPGALRASWQAAKTGLRVPLESEQRLAARGEVSPQEKAMPLPYLAHTSPDWGAIKAVADWLGVPMVARNAAELAAGGWSGRFANMQHTFFKVLNDGAQAHQNAYIATVNEGLSPLTSQDFMGRYKYHLLNPTDDVLRDNVNAGYAGTFMEKLGKNTQRLASALKNTPLRWEFPFLHVPVNIARKGISYTPFAIFGPEMAAELAGLRGARKQAFALTRVATGTAVLSYVMSQTMQGKVTGDYPTDPEERKRWQELSIPPNSIQIGGWWVSYQRWGPARIPMSVGANTAQILLQYRKDVDAGNDKEISNLISGSVAATIHSMGDEVGMLAIAQLIEAAEGTRTAAEFGGSLASSFAPYSVGLGQIAALKDPYLRKVESLTDALKYHLGAFGGRETLPPKVNVLGEPVYNPAFHSLLRVSPVTNDPVLLEMDRLGLHPAPLQNNVGDIKLPPALFERYQGLVYSGLRNSIDNLMHYPGWGNYPDYEKVKLIDTMFSVARDNAKAIIQQEQRGTSQDIIKQSTQNKVNQILDYKPGPKVKKLETVP